MNEDFFETLQTKESSLPERTAEQISRLIVERQLTHEDKLPSEFELAEMLNVGRGTAVDQEALIEALNGGRLAGAALDVMDPEPLPPDHPLWSAKNLILTPHVSGNMTLGYTCDRNVEMFCEDLQNYAQGRPLSHLVDRVRGY